MGKETGIEWTDHTFNPWWGCEKVSPACDRCYAESVSNRYGQGKSGWGKDAPRRFFADKHWKEPEAWNAAAAKANKPSRVFCASMADVFEERVDLEPHRTRLWALIERTPYLNWLLLTKRPENYGRMLPDKWLAHMPQNVWAGATAENERRFHERMAHLADVPAEVRFISYEPALEDVTEAFEEWHNWIDWIIIGGESGAGARPMNLDWARTVLAKCREHKIACFMKQIGGYPDKRKSLDVFPTDLKVREFP